MKFKLLIILLLLNGNIWTQKYPIQYFNGDDGIPHPQVSSIFQDSKGILWFSTFGSGLVSFDGINFKTYNEDNGLKGNIIRAFTELIENKKSRKFIGCFETGLYELKGDSAIHLIEVEEIGEIFHLIADHNGIWIGSTKGLFLYQNDNLIHINKTKGLIDGPVTYISSDKKGGIWFNFDSHMGVHHLNNDEIQQYDSTKGLPEVRILATFTDSKDRTWVSAENGLYKKEPKENKFNKVECKHLPDFYLFNIEELPDQRLIIPSNNNGIIIYNPDENKVEYMANHHHGFKSSTAFRILLDRENNLWVSNWGYYVAKFSLAGLYYYDASKGLEAKLNTNIENYNKGVLVSSSSGFFYKNDASPRFEKIFPEVEDAITCFGWKNDTLWYATETELKYYVNGNITTLNDGRLSAIKTIQSDENNLYFGSWSNGIFKWGNGEITSIQPFDLEVNHIYNGFYDTLSQTHYFSTWNAGIILLKDKKWTQITGDLNVKFTKTTSSCVDLNGDLWIGTPGNGIIWQQPQKTISINTINGFPLSTIYSIECDANNRIWALTTLGLICIETENQEITHTKIIDASRGFEGTPIYDGMLFKNGLLYTLTSDRVWIFDDQLYYDPIYNLAVYLTNFIVNGEPQEIENELQFTLAHHQNTIKIQFATSQINGRNQQKYFYRIKEKSQEFTPLGSNNQIDYPELPPGNYTIEIKACIGVNCSDTPLLISIQILAPWWASLWFKIVMVLITIIIIYLTFKWRTKRLIAKQKELEKIVLVRTAEVVKQKNEAEYQRELVEEKNQEILDSINYAKRLQQAILPPLKIVKEYLKESFIYYLPKDIVAGDFYFMETIQNETGYVVYYVAADCTGHGVPGAMVSVVGANGLKRCIREFGLRKPGEILDQLSKLVTEAFEQSEEQINDGMDLALVALHFNIDNHCYLIEFSGANNPLWMINPSRSEWPENAIPFKKGGACEFKATKQPIGYYEDRKPFETFQIQPQKGDLLYTFSDGFADQFGGADEHNKSGKKFKSANFKKLVLSIYELPLEEQKEKIEIAFEEWKGELEQVDDICIIGVRL